jgi:methionyl aminopeptidase
MMTSVKTTDELLAMRESGRMLATVLHLLKKHTKAGISPIDMSHLASKELKSLGGRPTFKGYHGYPDIICISVNNQVQHGIPSNKPFTEGDVVNYDFGVTYKNMITDAGITVGVGKINEDAERLITGTEEALGAGISKVHNGTRVGDISAAIEATLTRHDLGIVRDLVGHGVGYNLHEDPNIPNYGRQGHGPVLYSGMTIAIEPIATLGGYKIEEDPDGWTLWTEDGSWSAQFEHTVLVTEKGAEILTQL